MKQLEKKQKAIISAMVFLLLISSLLGVPYYNWHKKYQNKINPGIRIGVLDLSGLTTEEATKKIDEAATRLESLGLPLTYNNQKVVLSSTLSVSSDLSFPIFVIDREKTLEKVLATNPNNSFSFYLKNSLRNSFSDYNIEAVYSLDKDKAKIYITDSLKNLEIPAKNASFKVKNSTNPISFEVEPESLGKKIDFDLAFSVIKDNLKYLTINTTYLKTITDRPTVLAGDLESLKPEAEALIARGDFILKNPLASSTWVVKKEVLASWITTSKKTNDLDISLDQEKIINYLEETIAPEINKEAALAKYEIKNGKMVSWQTGNDGRKLNLELSSSNIIEQYLNKQLNQADLEVEIVKNEITEDTDSLKIEEIIGTGHSNFAGSSANRRHNIKVGAEAINGILLAPGEEFSLVKNLGEIDAKAGYLPELVIKNNRTIPEYGGGLCQVATTIFRSALSSGLPITARQNHSYRVSYYEPAGTDAAVYDPWPDMRFVNDSPNYILIQSRLEKNDLYFDLWGKKDGRVVTSTAPVIYNIVKPAATKIIETTDLKPGEKKCTEKPHNGADAYFDYSVTYSNGENKSTRFKSHYVPWQEVCLIGKDIATSTPVTITDISTSTPTSTPN